MADLLLKEDEQKVVNVLQSKSESFPRSLRVCNKKEFALIYAGKRISGAMFRVYYNILGDIGKAGFVVSKKVSKSAVKRNKIKRRLREIYRRNRDMLPANISIVIQVLPQAAEASFDEIKREILSIFKSITSKKHSDNNNKIL